MSPSPSEIRPARGLLCQGRVPNDQENDTFVLPRRSDLGPSTRVDHATIRSSTTATGNLARPARSGPATAAIGSAASRGWRTRPCSTAWRQRLAAYPEVTRLAQDQRRAPVRHDQAMDEPGRVPDALAGERAGRVRPDRARLQYPTSHHPRRHSRPDRGFPGVKYARLASKIRKLPSKSAS